MGIYIKGFNIAPLVNLNSGTIEITKKLFRQLVNRKRLTENFIKTVKKVLLKQGIYTVETEQDSYIFTKPIKRYDNFISFKVDLKSASELIKSEQLECRTCDIKLMELLDEAECLFNELEGYPGEGFVDGKSVSFFDTGKNEHGVFVLLEDICEIREALTEVYYKNLKAKDFRDEFECFFDGVLNDTVWGFVDRISIEEAENLPDKDDLMVVLDDLASALQQAHEQYQLTYS